MHINIIAEYIGLTTTLKLLKVGGKLKILFGFAIEIYVLINIFIN